jgi:hypothetical protein
MGSSYLERAALLEKGRMSPYMERLMDVETPNCPLDEEQYAIMALICDKCEPDDLQVTMFVCAVETAQQLMPSGYIHSRQILVTLAMFAGLADGN